MSEQIKRALIRRKRVEEITSLSRSSIYEKMRARTFPPCVRIGARSVAWRLDDIEIWLADPAGYTAPTPQAEKDRDSKAAR